MPDPTAIIPKEKQEELVSQANLLSKSLLIPDEFKERPANCALALDYAFRMKLAPLAVMKGMYVFKGKVGWHAEFMLGRLVASGHIEGTVRYEEEGDGDSMRTRAIAVDSTSGSEVTGTWVSMALAHAEGWTRNSKYKTMPQNMLRKRAAVFLIRDHYPNVLQGLPLADEIEDVYHAQRAKQEAAVEAATDAYNSPRDVEVE